MSRIKGFPYRDIASAYGSLQSGNSGLKGIGLNNPALLRQKHSM